MIRTSAPHPTRRGRRTALCAAFLAAAAAAGVAVSPASAAPAVNVTPVQLRVTVGPDNQECNLDVDVYVPATATAKHPAPVVITTNGYLGNKAQTGAGGAPASIATLLARHGYVAVSYSGLGWGASSCLIELNNPAWDGRAAAQLLDYLGGDRSRAFRHYAKDPARTGPGVWSDPVSFAPPVLLDRAGDPRAGFIGNSYGGGAALAAAASSKKLDTVVAQATWSELAYSLAPNDLAGSIRATADNPGVAKTVWDAALSQGGPQQVLQGNGGGGASTCLGFDPRVCPVFDSLATRGYLSGERLRVLQESSPLRYASRIRIPTYLLQGQGDSLFNYREASELYTALRAQHTPVKLVWQSWGHDSSPAPGEEDNTTDPAATLNSSRYTAWMDTHLRGAPDKTGPAFQWFRGYVPYRGSGPNDEQYGTAPQYPLPTTVTYRLSGGAGSDGDLTSGRTQKGTTSFMTSLLPATSYSGTPSAGAVLPPFDAPGTAVAYTSPPLTSPVDVVGSGRVRLLLNAAAFADAQGDPSRRLVLFAKLYDLAPDGTAVLPAGLVSAVRVPDVTRPVDVALPAIAHRFAPGHRIRLVVAQGDSSYKGNVQAAPVQVLAATPASDSAVTLPVSGPEPARAEPATTRPATPSAAPGERPTAASLLPATGPSGWFPAAACTLLTLALGTRRHRSRRASAPWRR